MNHYTQYLNYHVSLLTEFKTLITKQPPFNLAGSSDETNTESLSEQDQQTLDTLDALCKIEHYHEPASEQGQWLISRIVSTYSHLMPLLNRDLLWFFGGDCLHYMPDSEILFYQQLDELRYAAEEHNKPFDYVDAKRRLSTVTPI